MPWHRSTLLCAAGIAATALIPAVSFSAPQNLHVRTFTMEQVAAIPGHQVLHLVPGGGEPRDGLAPATDRWYIGADADAAERFASILSTRPGARPEAVVSAAAAEEPAIALAIHPRVNPGPAALEVECGLPGREPARVELFDVMGRRLAGRDLALDAPGRVTVPLGTGLRLSPGSYWVKLAQGSRSVTTRVVIARPR